MKPAPLIKQWSIKEPEAILDYLHDETLTNEVKACCDYEYARASKTLQQARRNYLIGFRGLKRKRRGKWRPTMAEVEQAASKVLENSPGWLAGHAARAFWQCPSYPRLPWRQLSGEQRGDFQTYLAPPGPRSVITDVRTLAGMKIFEKFERAARTAIKHKDPMVCPPRVTAPGIDYGIFRDGYEDVRVRVPTQNPSAQYVVFTIRYTDGVDVVKERIARWLENEENKKLFKQYHKRAIDKGNLDSPQRYKEHLKYLAAWRLYDELGFKKAAEWTKDNRRQQAEQFGNRPFFAEKPKRIVNGEKFFVGPLYKERRDWEGARKNAQSFLRTEIESGGMC